MGLIKKLKRYGSMVMFSHTIFSLPFGLVAMIWAANGLPPVQVFFWIVIALLGARNGANAFNRIADRHIDKKNPRTAGRDIPSGRVSVREAYGVTIFCFLMMAVAAFMLNVTCLLLLPVAICIFVLYSYSKRVTWLCHIILGMACAGAPVGAWLAVTGTVNLTCLCMASAVTCWVSGFDVIYALQDISYDRKEGLHSIPARFGLGGARMIAAFLHICALFFLSGLYILRGMGVFFLIGTVIIGLLLMIEHAIVVPGNAGRMKTAAYGINQIVGMVFLVSSLLDFYVVL